MTEFGFGVLVATLFWWVIFLWLWVMSQPSKDSNRWEHLYRKGRNRWYDGR